MYSFQAHHIYNTHFLLRWYLMKYHCILPCHLSRVPEQPPPILREFCAFPAASSRSQTHLEAAPPSQSQIWNVWLIFWFFFPKTCFFLIFETILNNSKKKLIKIAKVLHFPTQSNQTCNNLLKIDSQIVIFHTCLVSNALGPSQLLGCYSALSFHILDTYSELTRNLLGPYSAPSFGNRWKLLGCYSAQAWAQKWLAQVKKKGQNEKLLAEKARKAILHTSRNHPGMAKV